jgi:hypothetical protein
MPHSQNNYIFALNIKNDAAIPYAKPIASKAVNPSCSLHVSAVAFIASKRLGDSLLGQVIKTVNVA